MGGGMSLNCINRLSSDKVLGVFCLSSFLVNNSSVYKTEPIKSLPLLMMHGMDDELIQYSWGQETATNLLLEGRSIEFQAYSHAGHEITDEMVIDNINR